MSPSNGAGVLEAGIAVVEREPAVENLVQLNFCSREAASLPVAQPILAVLVSIDSQLLTFNLPTPISLYLCLSNALRAHNPFLCHSYLQNTGREAGGGGRASWKSAREEMHLKPMERGEHP